MKLSNVIELLHDFCFAIFTAFIPTVTSLICNPLLIFRPAEVRMLLMANVWRNYSNGLDEGIRDIKMGLIKEYARGVVLEIGAGHGHNARYLDKALVSRYIALEPNQRMHSEIRSRANDAGFFESDGSLSILKCGAEDIDSIFQALEEHPKSEKEHGVDTILSVLTLCSVPEPQMIIKGLCADVLSPGGQLLYYEHVMSPRGDVFWWQKVWAPVWGFAFGGCTLGRPTDKWIKTLRNEGNDESLGCEGSMWKEWKEWGKEGEDPDCLFWHSIGRFVKQ